tara:strand:- start:699 stop:1724 length:1026 start_codon:yes stop_codon:yes gene_type:complete
MKKRKVFILGGGGFIGSAIARILVNRGNYDITIGDNFYHNQNDEEFMNFIDSNKIRLIYDDFSDPLVFEKLDLYYDDFYMLASMIGVNFTLKYPHEVIRVNTALIYNSLEWLKKVKVKNVLFTSTSECYSGTIDLFNFKIPTSEKVPLCIEDIHHPRWTYASTKILGESGFLNYAKHIGFKCKIIRYNNIIGPKMGFGHIIPHLVERFLKGESPFKIYGAKQTRSFCFIDDGALGTIQAMEAENATSDIFHIGSDCEITIEDFVKKTGELMNYSGDYINAPTYPGSVSRRCPDLTKSRKILNFKINYSWEEALQKTLNWYIEYFKKFPNKSCFEKPDKYYK